VKLTATEGESLVIVLKDAVPNVRATLVECCWWPVTATAAGSPGKKLHKAATKFDPQKGIREGTLLYNAARNIVSCEDLDDDCDGEVDEDIDLCADVDNCGVCGQSCDVGAVNATFRCVTTAASGDLDEQAPHGLPSLRRPDPLRNSAASQLRQRREKVDVPSQFVHLPGLEPAGPAPERCGASAAQPRRTFAPPHAGVEQVDGSLPGPAGTI
jgi:hypothetical protein